MSPDQAHALSPRVSEAPAAAQEPGLARLAALQRADGGWEGEVVWCPMITAQVAIARRLVGAPLAGAHRDGVIRYFAAEQRPDGGWGMHPLSPSTLFATTLVYVALRLLEVPADAAPARLARAWIAAHPEGVEAIPSWGKLWLAMLGLYEYEGINPCPPELFLLPRRGPFHPDQLYCHTRYIYLALAYLSGRRQRFALGPLQDALRSELYRRPYQTIDFRPLRHRIAASDLYVAPTRSLRLGYDAIAALGRAWRMVPGSGALRRRALARCLGRIRFEEQATRRQCLSPVNGVLNLLCLWTAEGRSPAVEAAIEGLEAWRWEDAGGIRYAGARSQSWDSAFALQALAAAPAVGGAARAALAAGYRYLVSLQLTEALPGAAAEGRDPLEGGWCFSDGAHRWPVSDCTAEAISALLACHAVPGAVLPDRHIPEARLDQAIRFLLSRQNADGGFGTYERRRGGARLERLNPSEMFGQCMTERSYVECTASAVRALAEARHALPAIAAAAGAAAALERGIAFLRRAQRADGAYPGFWGINFVYATWMVLVALKAAGLPDDDATVAAAARWVQSKQRPDGGWGEHYSGCLSESYVENEHSLVTGTSWAVLALAALDRPPPAVAAGAAWLAAKRRGDGSWPADPVNGVFFGAAMLDYRLYCAIFPAWALARAAAVLPQ
jgi:lanosterol synthase